MTPTGLFATQFWILIDLQFLYTFNISCRFHPFILYTHTRTHTRERKREREREREMGYFNFFFFNDYNLKNNNDQDFEKIKFYLNSLQQFQVVSMCHTVNFEFKSKMEILYLHPPSKLKIYNMTHE